MFLKGKNKIMEDNLKNDNLKNDDLNVENIRKENETKEKNTETVDSTFDKEMENLKKVIMGLMIAVVAIAICIYAVVFVKAFARSIKETSEEYSIKTVQTTKIELVC